MNTKFRDNTTGQEVYIKNKSGDFLTLSNGLKIKSDFFIKKYTPVTDIENDNSDNIQIQPDNFFKQNNDYLSESKKNGIIENIKQRQIEIDKIQQNINEIEKVDATDFLYSTPPIKIDGLENILKMDTTNIKDVPESQQSGVVIRESIDGSGMPVQKANIQSTEIKSRRLTDEEIKKFQQIDDDDLAADQLLKHNKQELIGNVNQTNTNSNNNIVDDEEQLTGKKSQKSQKSQIQQETNNTQQNEPIDFIGQMFKTFKRNYPITIDIKITDYISEPEFIRLMSNNLNADIIGLYTQEVLNRILSDVIGLEQKIHDIIEKEVYGENESENENANKLKNEISEPELIPADKTKTDKQKYYYFNGKKVVKLLKETAIKNNYRPATKKEINGK